jgi:Cu/Ag efflux protein CusF
VTEAKQVEGVKAGDQVAMKCSQVNGAWVLRDLDRKRGKRGGDDD